MTVPSPIPCPIPILFEDDDLVAIDKPAGSVVHRTRGAEDALILWQAVAAQVGTKIHPIHRLDRQTSGVLVFAKSAGMAKVLGTDIREGRWRKTYLALCRGPIPDPLTIDHPVPEGTKRRPAVTHVEPLETICGRFTLVKAMTTRGRRHQVRYHLKHVNHPLVADTNYGKGPINRYVREQTGLDRLFLHATTLVLAHPRLPQSLTLHAPLAPDLSRALEILRTIDSVPV